MDTIIFQPETCIIFDIPRIFGRTPCGLMSVTALMYHVEAQKRQTKRARNPQNLGQHRVYPQQLPCDGVWRASRKNLRKMSGSPPVLLRHATARWRLTHFLQNPRTEGSAYATTPCHHATAPERASCPAKTAETQITRAEPAASVALVPHDWRSLRLRCPARRFMNRIESREMV